ncbi:MAG: ECF-type sigma factor [Planctomycetota bacterium JB042]
MTRLLARVGDDPSGNVTDELLPLVYEELRRLAQQVLRNEGSGRTLQPTALVHEAYLRLADQSSSWQNRRHFLGVAAQAMRRIVIDAARMRRADRRGGGWQRVTLSAESGPGRDSDVDLLAVDEALTELGRLSPRQARLVELRFFAGLSVEEAAGVLDVSRSTAEADWRVARAWLAARLDAPPPPAAD